MGSFSPPSSTPTFSRCAPSGSVTHYAIVHNAATFTRDMAIRIRVSGPSKRYIRSSAVTVVGSGRQVRVASGQTLTLRGMKPGENRWVMLSVDAPGVPVGGQAYITADEIVGGIVVNGFGVGVRPAPAAVAVRESLQVWRQTALRLEAGFGAKASAADIKASEAVGPSRYAAFVRTRILPDLRKDLERVAAAGGTDPFGVDAHFRAISADALSAKLVGDMASLLNVVDARLTSIQLQKGDPADILQMVRWQKELFQRDPRLSKSPCAAKVVEASEAFLQARQSGKVTNAQAYPPLLLQVRECLMQAAASQAPGDLSGGDLSELERQHRAYLLAISKS